MLIMVSLWNSTSPLQVFSMWSAAMITIFSLTFGSAPRNLATHLSNMLICSSVSAICWLESHCNFNGSIEWGNGMQSFSPPNRGIWSGLTCHRCPFPIKVLANKLEMAENSPMLQTVHVQFLQWHCQISWCLEGTHAHAWSCWEVLGQFPPEFDSQWLRTHWCAHLMRWFARLSMSHLD